MDKRTDNTMDKRTNKTKGQTTIYKTLHKNWRLRKTACGDFMCSGRVVSYCSTSDSLHITVDETNNIWYWTSVQVNKHIIT
jgi:hypothetical protein